MIEFPTEKQDYNQYIYNSGEHGLVYFYEITQDAAGNERISFVNQDRNLFNVPIEDFTEINFTPLILATQLAELVQDIQKVRGLNTFSATFPPTPLTPEEQTP